MMFCMQQTGSLQSSIDGMIQAIREDDRDNFVSALQRYAKFSYSPSQRCLNHYFYDFSSNSAKRFYLLDFALSYWSVNICNYLLTNGAYVSEGHMSLLRRKIMQRHIDLEESLKIIKLFCNTGVPCSRYFMSAILSIACYVGDNDFVRFILKDQSNICLIKLRSDVPRTLRNVFSEQASPLECAQKGGQTDVVQYLESALIEHSD